MDTARALSSVLSHFGFRKIQRACWEHTSLTMEMFTKLKREIDRVTDYYDIVRLYQYPVQNSFAVTELERKRWRRCFLRSNKD